MALLPRLRGSLTVLTVVAAALSVASPATATERRDLSVLQQGYATSLPVDAYGDQGTDLHVAEVGGTSAYRSYVSFSTEPLSAGDVIDRLQLTLVPDTGSNGDQNTAAAALQACPL